MSNDTASSIKITMESIEEEEEQQPLKLYFIPYLAAGHLIPLCDIASLFAARGHTVTIITTPSNAQILPKSHHFRIQTFQFPSQQVGLPDGVENLSATTNLDEAYKIYEATFLLRKHIEHFVEQNPPDCIVADFLYPWVDDLANKLQIPRLSFNGFSLFTICAMESLKSHPLPEDASGSFVIPQFPHHITINLTPPKSVRGFLDPLLMVALKSYGYIVNSFVELDGEEFVEYYEKSFNHRTWHLGPASLVPRTVQEKAERGQKKSELTEKCLSWLNSKGVNSVVYISFGSICYFPDKQLYEIASAIEASGHGFIWVVPEKKGKENESEDEKEKWLPRGFEERNVERGVIIRGWAPQVVILEHHAVGAFVTHCGWNSVTEAICAGVPMITWPVLGDQFYNEKLITQVQGIGVEVGVKEWLATAYRETKKVVWRDQIEKAVRKLMDGGDEVEKIRQRVQEFGKKATRAVQEDGSSFRNLTALIDDLKRLRDFKLINGV